MRDIDTLVDLKVISVAEGRQLGAVSAVVCDLATARMVGIIMDDESELAVRADDILTLGEHAIMVPTADVAHPVHEVPELAARRTSGQGVQEVVTSDGRRLGTLTRIYIDPETKGVTSFEVSGGLWRDMTEGVLVLPKMPGTIHGGDVVIVPAEATALTSGGIRERLERVSERVKAGYQTVAERAEDVFQAARDTIQDVRPGGEAKEAAVDEGALCEGCGEKEPCADEPAACAEGKPCAAKAPCADAPCEE